MTSTIFQELIEQELSILKEMVSQIDSKKEGHLKGTALELRIRNMLGKLIPSYCF